MIPLTFPVTYDLDDDIAGCKAGFTRKSTFKDAKGEFVIQDPVFREIPPERQNWVLHKDQRNKKMQNDTTFRELGLIEVLGPMLRCREMCMHSFFTAECDWWGRY